MKYKISEIFDLSQKTNNSSFTKEFVEKHKGTIPVYSASKEENIAGYGFIQDNVEGVKYFENCLTFNFDGEELREFNINIIYYNVFFIYFVY